MKQTWPQAVFVWVPRTTVLKKHGHRNSVADPYVFRPPGSESGSSSQRYGSGSGSFYRQAKTVRKTLIPTAM
jgi:hypothetical protein